MMGGTIAGRLRDDGTIKFRRKYAKTTQNRRNIGKLPIFAAAGRLKTGGCLPAKPIATAPQKLNIMAKMFGFNGRVSGKMGNAVFRVRSGQQVVTQYNPIVTNPNTEKQQGSRARFKLVSQLAVVFAPYLRGFGSFVIKTRAEKAGRGINKSINAAFVGLNYRIAELDPEPWAAEKAVIDISKVQLTASSKPFGTIELSQETRDDQRVIVANIASPGASNLKRKGKIALVGFGTMGVTKSPYVIEMQDFEFEEDGAEVVFNTPVLGQYTVLAFGVDPDPVAIRGVTLNTMKSVDEYTAEVDINTMATDGTGNPTATIGANITLVAGA